MRNLNQFLMKSLIIINFQKTKKYDFIKEKFFNNFYLYNVRFLFYFFHVPPYL